MKYATCMNKFLLVCIKTYYDISAIYVMVSHIFKVILTLIIQKISQKQLIAQNKCKRELFPVMLIKNEAILEYYFCYESFIKQFPVTKFNTSNNFLAVVWY